MSTCTQTITKCWLYTGSFYGNGYGRIYDEQKEKLAHRIAYEVFVGPIPDGMVVDHMCRNKLCLNPKHLDAVTQGENAMRGIWEMSGTSRKDCCSRGHEYSGDNVRITPLGVRKCMICKRRNEKEYYDKNRDMVLGAKALRAREAYARKKGGDVQNRNNRKHP